MGSIPAGSTNKNPLDNLVDFYFVEFFGVEEDGRCQSYGAGGQGQRKYVPILSLCLDLFVKCDIIIWTRGARGLSAGHQQQETDYEHTAHEICS